MPNSRSRVGPVIAAIAALGLAGLAIQPAAQADPGGAKHDHGSSTGAVDDTTPVPPDFNHGKPQRLKHQAQLRRQSQSAAAGGDAQVGDTKTWLAEDDYKSSLYLKDYTLRGIGDHIQVWVANDTAFPGDDCRNALGLTDITDAQVSSFISEFDGNIYPKESESFSTPPSRDGSHAETAALGKPDGYYQVEQDQADDIVVLVDNVRDANYYAPATPEGQTYIAGFFYSVFNEYTDRNIMTIDAYDWLHRTSANPPDDTDNPAYQDCPYAAGSPRPRLYEGTFAHEYQHLLEYYQDPDEVSWVNEGLSDYAQTLVGYVDPSVPVTDPQADSHIACFSGFLSDQGYGGPENSLTQWQDQGGPEILCDYGAAYSFMQYLFGHYGGEDFMSALHREPGNGLEGLDHVLDSVGAGDSAMDAVHQWAATSALDNVVDGGATLTGGDAATYTEDSLGMAINWDATYGDIDHDGTFDDPGNEAYSTPGAAPNGSDYVRLTGRTHGKTAGQYLTARDLKRLTFDASGTLAPDPVEWTVDSTPPEATDGLDCPSTTTGTGAAALYSGCGPNLDRAIVTPVSVPAGGGDLTFQTLYQTEEGWDFGFVQVYDEDSQSYTSVPCTDTTSETAAGAISGVQSNVPGFTGDSGGWLDETCDLSAYAGQDVDLAFRYVTDSGLNLAGWWVRDIAVDGTAVADGTSLSGWQSGTQAHPLPVHGFTVQLVGYGDGSHAYLGQLPVTRGRDGDFHGRLRAKQVRSLLGNSEGTTTVAAIVMQDDPTETVAKYAGYRLAANGVVQPGG